MKALLALENNMLDELYLCKYEDVAQVFYMYKRYVPDYNVPVFENEALTISNEYTKALNEEENKVGLDETKFENKKEFRIRKIKDNTKVALVSLIKYYFDESYYKQNKESNNIVDPEEVEERELTILDLRSALTLIRKQIKPFLYSVGYYQYREHYFISFKDKKEINNRYTNDLKKLYSNWPEMKNVQYFDLFSKNNPVKFPADLDYDSIISLVLPYFKHNIKELIGLAQVIYKNPYYSEKRIKEIDKFIKEHKNDLERIY